METSSKPVNGRAGQGEIKKVEIFAFCDSVKLSIVCHTVWVWYGILEFNVPLDTIQVISETGALSSDVHLPFTNGGPAT